jgi:hypothetical protein
MVPLVAALLQQGLSILGGAVLAKGKEAVEEKLGIKLPDGDKPLDPAQVVELKKAEMQHEEWLIEAGIRRQQQEIDAERIAQGAVSERWQADMLSDSWLSKNIRPMVLVYLLTVYTLFSFSSGFQFNITESYIELLAQMLMLVMGAYFAGRTIEKIVDMRERGK